MVRLTLDVDEFIQPEAHLAEIGQGQPSRFLAVAAAFNIGGLLFGDKVLRRTLFCFSRLPPQGGMVALVNRGGNSACF